MSFNFFYLFFHFTTIFPLIFANIIVHITPCIKSSTQKYSHQCTIYNFQTLTSFITIPVILFFRPGGPFFAVKLDRE